MGGGDHLVRFLRALPGRSLDEAATFDSRIADMLVLVRAGERTVAVEMLVSNLCEYDVRLDASEQGLLTELVASVPVDDSTREVLRLLTDNT